MKLSLFWLAALPVSLAAQTAPTAYTVVEVNSMFGDPVTQIIARDGNKAYIENQHGGTRTRSVYDLAAGSNLSWDAADPANGCSSGKFKGDWGDPFAMGADFAGQLKAPKQDPTETIAGIPTRVTEGASTDAKAKLWIDPVTGLLMKLEVTQGNQPARVVIEVKKFNTIRPPASTFTIPANCLAPPAPVPSPLTPANPDFVNAITAPDAPGTEACSVVFRILKADTYEPVTGLQVSANLEYNVDNPEASKGSLHPIARPYRIANAPPIFDIQIRFPNGAGSGALIHRQCFGPRTVLLLLLKNPANPIDGVEWVWATQGKLAR